MLNKQEEIVESVGVLGVSKLVGLPQAKCLYENLKAPYVGGLLREVRDNIPTAHGPDREHAHCVQPAGRADQFIVVCSKQQR